MYKKENGQKAEKSKNQRYKEENYIQINIRVRPEYAKKIEYIMDTLNISKAETIKKAVDTLYSELWLD